MDNVWQLMDAKNKLSEVVDRASREGPQRITRRGVVAAVVMSAKDYDCLKGRKESLVAFLRRAPLKGLDLERVRDVPRQIKL